MTIALDLDGVLANFVGAFNALAQQAYGWEAPDVAPRWQWLRDCKGWTLSKEGRLWDHVANTPDWWAGVPEYPWTWDSLAIANALQVQHRLYYLTCRVGPTAWRATRAWLMAHGAHCPTVLWTRGENVDVLRDLDVDVVVKDNPEFIAAARFGNLETLYVPSWPYTQDVNEGDPVECYSPEQLPEVLRRLV